ncbi:hypothetical protein SBP18_06305 [Rhodoferax ferrireducens]|uniref:hypothetical protein n=1 Tax=Rhodoferax ferrireducens TaxID=192843 RepID=UPI00298DF5F1|nr:hypothetical protein [Rhodoferax ferrireducens]WPC68122.1 hypothetical protein SBP18_06305 [Rhodoferax ferrireducens]
MITKKVDLTLEATSEVSDRFKKMGFKITEKTGSEVTGRNSKVPGTIVDEAWYRLKSIEAIT